MSLEDKVKIIVDSRELNNDVTKKLFELGVEIESKRLEVGDFILSEQVCVERKTVSDFIGSIIDGRLFEQASNMSWSFEKPVIIVEGVQNFCNNNGMHPNALRGAISSIAIDFRVPIIQTTSEIETALFLYMIASREQIDKRISVNLRGGKKPRRENYLIEYIVSGIPGVGSETAKNLLKEFKSVKNVFSADIKELKKVKKIGKKKAELIKKISEQEWKEIE